MEIRITNPASDSIYFKNSVTSSGLTENIGEPKKLNYIHYALIGVFFGFAGCTVAATIYAFSS
jgi:hypothetical protein